MLWNMVTGAIAGDIKNILLFTVLTGKPFKVDTIVIPSDSPFFLTIIGIHVLAAMVCVIVGIAAMLLKKRHGLHSKFGTTYFYGLLVVFITVIIISYIRWEEDYPLLILGALSFCCAFVARFALRHKWKRWPVYHVSGMGLSYIILLTAFYVDNGKFLPVWKDLPPIMYWILPSIVGIPIILITLYRHPVVKYDGKQE